MCLKSVLIGRRVKILVIIDIEVGDIWMVLFILLG